MAYSKKYGIYYMVPQNTWNSLQASGPKPPTPEPPKPSEESQEHPNYDGYLYIVPTKYRTRALTLLNMMHDNGTVVNNEFEVVIQGKTVNGSNILSLLRDAFVPKSSYEPAGMTQFYQFLKDIHVPSQLIVNAERKFMIDNDVHKKTLNIDKKTKRKVVKK